MNLLDARHMSEEEIDQYDGDLKAFLLMLRDRFNEEKLKTAVATHRETWYALSEVKNDKRYREYIDSISDEELKGGIYMDAALDYIEARGEAGGEARGTILGMEKINKLGIMLSEIGRTGDFMKSLSDRALQKKLLIGFGLEEEK